jgi:hypothetical protein
MEVQRAALGRKFLKLPSGGLHVKHAEQREILVATVSESLYSPCTDRKENTASSNSIMLHAYMQCPLTASRYECLKHKRISARIR